MAWAITQMNPILSSADVHFNICRDALEELAESEGLSLAELSDIEMATGETPVIFGREHPHEVQDITRDWNEVADDDGAMDVPDRQKWGIRA